MSTAQDIRAALEADAFGAPYLDYSRGRKRAKPSDSCDTVQTPVQTSAANRF
jgi:hypothetical protein